MRGDYCVSAARPERARISTPGIRAVIVLVTALIAGLAGCGDNGEGDHDPDQVDALSVPPVNTCRVLTPADAERPDNATHTVDCEKPHTARTYKAGPLPDTLKDVDYDAPELTRFAYQICSVELQAYLGTNESTVMRSMLSWVWFRPSKKAWSQGARWYRCDVVAGGMDAESYIELPTTVAGLLSSQKISDEWMVCANGASVRSAPKVPCSEKHTWRAVTTIKVGDPDSGYPGDEVVEETTREYCSSSVGAWLGYPKDYDFGYTWFGEKEWSAGNRRSVCWAATSA